MIPLEAFSPAIRGVGHVTLQAWGNGAFARLAGHGAAITGILPQLGILAAYAAVLLALATWRRRRVLLA
jgi:linearmycin/streptolysin S transport system permease protein